VAQILFLAKKKAGVMYPFGHPGFLANALSKREIASCIDAQWAPEIGHQGFGKSFLNTFRTDCTTSP
jgi:hypothetical protein